MYVNKISYLLIGVTVSIARSKYSVTENSKTLMVNITMNATTSENVVVNVTISDGSAKGK